MALYLSVIATALLILNQVPRDSAFFTPYALALASAIGLSLVGGATVYWWGRAMGDDDDRALDERQVAVRNDAYKRAYGVVAGAFVALVQYLVIAPGFGWPMPERPLWITLSFSVLLVTATLPSASLAWREPDLSPDDPAPVRRAHPNLIRSS